MTEEERRQSYAEKCTGYHHRCEGGEFIADDCNKCKEDINLSGYILLFNGIERGWIKPPQEKYVPSSSNTLFMTIKPVYGRRFIFPSCEKSRLFLKIGKGNKTIPFDAIPSIYKLGFNIKFDGDIPDDHEKMKKD